MEYLWSSLFIWTMFALAVACLHIGGLRHSRMLRKVEERFPNVSLFWSPPAPASAGLGRRGERTSKALRRVGQISLGLGAVGLIALAMLMLFDIVGLDLIGLID